MKHGLSGYLAGLSVLVGALESPRVLSCLTRCQESLDTPAMELLQPSMELLTNNGTESFLGLFFGIAKLWRVLVEGVWFLCTCLRETNSGLPFILEMTQITIEGNNVTNLETLIRRVAYVNGRDFPTPGRRPVSVTTNIL